jgi:hypothetical protein
MSGGMNKNNLPGILAGFAITFAGLMALAAGDSCSNALLERSSYIGGITVESQAVPAAPGDLHTSNPYGLATCDAWPSPFAQAITLLGALLIPLVGGAAATRIGSDSRPWRAIVATGLAAIGFAALMTYSGVRVSLVESLVLTAIAAALGALGALLVHALRRRARSSAGTTPCH